MALDDLIRFSFQTSIVLKLLKPILLLSNFLVDITTKFVGILSTVFKILFGISLLYIVAWSLWYNCINFSSIFVQRNCIAFALKAKPVRRYIPKHRCQYKVWWFVTSQPFEYTIFVLIMVNTITLAMKFYKQSTFYDSILDMLNLIFTAVFALEFVFKLAAFRFKVIGFFLKFVFNLK